MIVEYILAQQLLQARHTLQEQEKIIANLEEVNKGLRSKIKPAKIDPGSRTKLGRNKSWRRAAALGLREGIWLAPTRLIESVWKPFLGIFGAALFVIVGSVVWLIASIGMVVAGLCGFLVESKEKK